MTSGKADGGQGEGGRSFGAAWKAECPRKSPRTSICWRSDSIALDPERHNQNPVQWHGGIQVRERARFAGLRRLMKIEMEGGKKERFVGPSFPRLALFCFPHVIEGLAQIPTKT